MDISSLKAQRLMTLKYTKFFQVPFLKKDGNFCSSFYLQEKVFMQIKLLIK